MCDGGREDGWTEEEAQLCSASSRRQGVGGGGKRASVLSGAPVSISVELQPQGGVTHLPVVVVVFPEKGNERFLAAC